MSPYVTLLEEELEEARDTIERLVAEKIGITKQRDELKKQLTIAIEQNCELRKGGDPMSLFGIAPDLGEDQTKDDE